MIGYEQGGELKIIEHYKAKDYIPDEENVQSLRKLPFTGNAVLELLPNDRIIYSHSGLDKFKKNGKHYYVLNISNYDGSNKLRIEHFYSPVIVPEIFEARFKKFEKYLDSEVFMPFFSDVKVDGIYVYVFTYELNDEDEILVDIFDSQRGEYVRSVYFPFIPYFLDKGRAFRQFGAGYHSSQIEQMQNSVNFETEFSKVEIYKINEKIYKQ